MVKKKQGQSDLPAITGNQLIRLLEKEGWEIKRKATHGVVMVKQFKNEKRVTVVPTRSKSLSRDTLMLILGSKQTSIGREGLLRSIEKYGIK